MNKPLLRRVKFSADRLVNALTKINITPWKMMAERFRNEVASLDYLEDTVSQQDCEELLRVLDEYLGGDANAIRDGAMRVSRIIENSLREPTPVSQTKFPFINDRDIQVLLDEDLQETERCQAQGFDKAVTVLTGCILEASLVGILRNNPTWVMDTSRNWKAKAFKGKPGDDIRSDDMKDSWSLSTLIDYACDNGILDDTKWRSRLHQAIREPRNLIHATAALRGKYTITRESANASLATLKEMLLDLPKSKLPPP